MAEFLNEESIDGGLPAIQGKPGGINEARSEKHGMEMLFEILFGIIVEGSLEASADKKVPLWIRIITGLILIVVYGGLVGFLLYEGIRSMNWGLLAIGIALLAFFAFGFRRIYRRRRDRFR